MSRPSKSHFCCANLATITAPLYELTITDFSEAHLANGLGRWEADTETTSQSTELLLAVAAALASDDARWRQN